MPIAEINFDTEIKRGQCAVVKLKSSDKSQVSWRQEVYLQDETTISCLITGAYYKCKSRTLDGLPVELYRIVSFDNRRLVIEDLPDEEPTSESI